MMMMVLLLIPPFSSRSSEVVLALKGVLVEAEELEGGGVGVLSAEVGFVVEVGEGVEVGVVVHVGGEGVVVVLASPLVPPPPCVAFMALLIPSSNSSRIEAQLAPPTPFWKQVGKKE